MKNIETTETVGAESASAVTVRRHPLIPLIAVFVALCLLFLLFILVTPVFFPKGTPVRKLLLKTAAEQIRAAEAAGTARYDPAWPQKMKRTFSRQHFYVTPEAFLFFWQMYDIAPAAEGFPVFELPIPNP